MPAEESVAKSHCFDTFDTSRIRGHSLSLDIIRWKERNRLLNTDMLLVKHSDLWRDATEHRFIDGVREGDLPEGAFETWLVQDYLFVLSSLRYQSRLVPRAPRRDQSLIIGGVVALEAELSWFENRASERNLSLEDTRHSDNESYNRFFTVLENESYVVNAVALWAVEQAYLDAWTNASPGAEEYREFVQHWTLPEFEQYVAGLKEAADGAFSRTDERQAHRAEDAFISIARLERNFWSLAYSKVEV